MSSTNKGELSTENWETPHWAVRRLLEEVWLPPGNWLEPCAGNGRIIQAVCEDRPGAISFTAVELRSECRPTLELAGVKKPNICCPTDFLTWNVREHISKRSNGGVDRFDVSMTNPPFSKSMEILSKCLVVSSYVAILQRLNWLGSGTNNGKNEFLHGCMPDVYIVPDRIKFLINGVYPRYPEGTRSRDGTKDLSGQLMPGDSIEYAWYVWGPPDVRFRQKGSVMTLRETSLEERSAG